MAIEVNGEVISNSELRAAVAQLRMEREQSGLEASLEERMALRDDEELQ